MTESTRTPSPPGPTRAILLVDDEEHVRIALARVLEQDGFAVFSAECGEDALGILQGQPVQLLISDQNMPGMSGLELLGEARRKHPHVLRIMLTGESDAELAVRSINEAEVYRFIRKPWSNADVRTIVRLAFEVIVLEAERRTLLETVRRYREARARGEAAAPEAEAELLLLAEADLVGT
jgi:DNA-binding NtrC family response regulator